MFINRPSVDLKIPLIRHLRKEISSTRKPRQVKVYKNPDSGEVVETKGGNHKTMKESKAEHGSATVESWLAK